MEFPWENLSDAIFHHAAIRPDAPAVMDNQGAITYRQFADLVGAAAVYLRDLGIGADDRVGLALFNHTDHFIIMFAAMRIGAVPIEVPAELPPQAQEEIFSRIKPKAIFVEAGLTSGRAPIKIVVDAHWRRDLDGKSGDARDGRTADLNRLVLLTSGSTGPAKGIVITHRQFMARARIFDALLGSHWSADRPGKFLLAVTITASAFHHFFLCQILHGGPVHVLSRFVEDNDFVRAVTAQRDAVLLTTPAICRALLSRCGTRDKLLPNAQALICGGLPLSAAEKKRVLAHITPNFFEVYGAAGSGLITGVRPADFEAHADSVGRCAPAPIVEIVNADGVPVPAGSLGHLRCRGEAIADGFLAGSGSNAGPEMFRDGWYYPGDIATMDADGWITLKGRKSDLILRRGVEFYPFEIEEVLLALPWVRDAAVIGRPAKQGGEEELVAIIVPGEGFKPDALAAHCAAHLPPEKRPVSFHRAVEFPRTPSGKTDRQTLRADFLAKTAARPPAPAPQMNRR